MASPMMSPNGKATNARTSAHPAHPRLQRAVHHHGRLRARHTHAHPGAGGLYEFFALFPLLARKKASATWYGAEDICSSPSRASSE